MTDYEQSITGVTPCRICNQIHAGTPEDYKGHLHESAQGIGYVRLLSTGEQPEYCWRCRCVKSGWVNVPNEVGEFCANENCLCHIADRAH